MDGCWETTERLWFHVIERAGDDTVGKFARGQWSLELYADIPFEKSGESRVEARNYTRSPMQQSLHGDPVPASELQGDDLHSRDTTLRRGDLNKSTGREKADQQPEQVCLNAWLPVDPFADWVINPRSNAGLCVAGEAVF